MTQPTKKPTIPEVIPIVKAYYAKPGNGVGGALHIVLDDENVEDEHIEYCKQYAAEIGDTDGIALAELLLRMSKSQRHKLCRRYSEYAS